jgi:hypothetical protein
MKKLFLLFFLFSVLGTMAQNLSWAKTLGGKMAEEFETDEYLKVE